MITRARLRRIIRESVDDKGNLVSKVRSLVTSGAWTANEVADLFVKAGIEPGDLEDAALAFEDGKPLPTYLTVIGNFFRASPKNVEWVWDLMSAVDEAMIRATGGEQSLGGEDDEKWLQYLEDVFGYSFDIDDVIGMNVKLHRNGLTISHAGDTKRTLKMPRGAGMFWMSEFVGWVLDNGGHEDPMSRGPWKGGKY